MFDYFARFMLWMIAFLVAVTVATHALAAAQDLLLPLGLLVLLVVILRVVWSRTRW